MEPLHDNNLIENVDKSLKQNEMVHIAETIHQENEINSDLDNHNENELQNNEIDVQISENRKSAEGNSENEDILPLEVKIEEDDAFDSYGDGSHVFRKYKFRQRDNKPE